MKTVSRVLNNEPNVAQATRERVRNAARELHYTPSLAARELAGSRSYSIALFYDDPSPSYLMRLQRGAVDACREAGYHLILEPISMKEADSLDLELKLSRLGVDAAILSPPLDRHKPLRAALQTLGIRMSIVSSAVETDAFVVGIDEFAAAYRMTDYLIELGHHDIGFIRGPDHHSAADVRFQAYRSALDDHGLIYNPDWVAIGDFSMQSGKRAGETLLNRLSAEGTRRPTAIFASNDDMAVGLIHAAMAHGIRVPKDLSVSGFDNTDAAKTVWPTLTTIDQPIQSMGTLAAKALITGDVEAKTQHLGFDLIERESTAIRRI